MFFQPPTNDQGKVYDKKSLGFGSFNLCIETNCQLARLRNKQFFLCSRHLFYEMLL